VLLILIKLLDRLGDVHVCLLRIIPLSTVDVDQRQIDVLLQLGVTLLVPKLSV
jgi:hypothetical protein